MRFFTALALWLAAAHAAHAAPSATQRWYLSSTVGNDTWSGLLSTPNAARTDGPVRSISRARLLVRGRSGRTAAAEVLMAPGTYAPRGVLEFDDRDGGDSAASGVAWRSMTATADATGATGATGGATDATGGAGNAAVDHAAVDAAVDAAGVVVDFGLSIPRGTEGGAEGGAEDTRWTRVINGSQHLWQYTLPVSVAGSEWSMDSIPRQLWLVNPPAEAGASSSSVGASASGGGAATTHTARAAGTAAVGHPLPSRQQRMTRGRSPNTGTNFIIPLNGALPAPDTELGFKFAAGDLDRDWGSPVEEMEVVVYASWSASRHYIDSLNVSASTVTFTAPCLNAPAGMYPNSGNRYYVENALATVDSPGEFYIAPSTGKRERGGGERERERGHPANVVCGRMDTTEYVYNGQVGYSCVCWYACCILTTGLLHFLNTRCTPSFTLLHPPSHTEDFSKEVSLLQQCSHHPNIVQLLGVCKDHTPNGTFIYFVTEFCPLALDAWIEVRE